MNKLILISLIIFFAICSRSWAEENCSGSDTSKWDNCIGTKTWPSGSSYTGEWSKGKTWIQIPLWILILWMLGFANPYWCVYPVCWIV